MLTAKLRRSFRPCVELLERRTLLSTTLIVDATPDKPGEFTTIQSAVDAAHSGDRIIVEPGTYTEQVTIPAGKDNLKLESQKPLKAIIQAPQAMTGTQAIVDVNGAQDTTIAGFTIEGPSPTIQWGVRVDSGGSAFIAFNHITNIRNDPLSDNQMGIAVMVGRFNPAAGDVTTGKAVVFGNTIDNYQKNGFLIGNTGSFADVEDNVVKGVGPTDVTAQNGIQVSDGADAVIAGNQVSGNFFTPETFDAVGILLFQPGHVKVEDNRVFGNFDGIYLFGTNGATVEGNRVHDNFDSGIVLDMSNNNKVLDNHVDKNAAEGIDLFDGSQGNRVEGNRANHNGDVGILAESDTSGNTFRDNKGHNNATFDAEDDSTGTGTAGTANTWTGNHFGTTSPDGLNNDHGHGHHHW
jgi:parallel beta-helix repeat protein